MEVVEEVSMEVVEEVSMEVVASLTVNSGRGDGRGGYRIRGG